MTERAKEFPLCGFCRDKVAGFGLGTHAPLCWSCVSGCDWSRAYRGAPPDIAAAIGAVALVSQSAAMLTRHATRAALLG